MKRTTYFLAILAMMFILPSCGSKENPIPNPGNDPAKTTEITIASPSHTLSSDGGNATISFTTNGSWTAVSNVDWIVLQQTSGDAGSISINIIVKENKDYDQRDGLVIISSSNVSKSVSVVQKQRDALLVTSNSIILDEEGGTPSIEVKSNIDYSCKVDDSAKSWISVLSTRGLKTSNITLSISENTNSSDRQGNVIVYSGDKKEVVTIYQRAKASGSTTSLAGTSWYYTWFSSGSSYTETISFRTDGTFIRKNTGESRNCYHYGTYEKSNGSTYQLTEQGYHEMGYDQERDYTKPLVLTAEIIDNVLYIYYVSGGDNTNAKTGNLWGVFFKL